MFQDLRVAARMLSKSPALTSVAVATLALGIGANTAIFSVIDGVLLRSLPFRQPSELVRLQAHFRATGQRDVGFSVPELQDLRGIDDIFDGVSAVWPADAALGGVEHATRVELLVVGTNYFSLLGAQPAIGRAFNSGDDAPGFAVAAIISDGLWRRVFGADPKVIGRELRLDNDAYTIVGIMPADFRHPGPTVSNDVDVWGTAGFIANPFPPPVRRVRLVPGAIARLKPGVTIEQAQERLGVVASRLRQEFPSDYPEAAGWSWSAVRLQESLVGTSRPLLGVLMMAAALILLIGCVNIASLWLVRATSRQREIAVRAALGATRRRLVRQLLTESVLLSALSGIVGLLAAAWTLALLLQSLPTNIPRLNEVHLNNEVLVFGMAMALVTGALFGIVPALRASRTDLVGALNEGGRSSDGAAQNRVRGLFVTAEIALSLVLLIGAGLLLRTFWNLIHVDPGFRADRVHVASIWIPVPNDPTTDRYATTPQRTALVREMLRRARTIPGVDAAGATTLLPLGGRTNRVSISIADRGETAPAVPSEFINITPEYLRTIGARLIRGRGLEETDEAGKPAVILVDESTAANFWPGADPLGKVVKLRTNAGGQGGQPVTRPLQVVGVLADIRHDGLDVDGVPHVFTSMYQFNNKVLSVVVHARTDQDLGKPLHAALEGVDPDLPIFGLTTMQQTLEASLAQRRFAAAGVMIFAAIAIVLAAIGVYGVIGYSVAQRMHEFGVRMALGARPRDLVALVLREGLLLVGLGIAAGATLAVPFARLLRTLLYSVDTVDPLVFTGGSLLLLVIALLAAYAPARRAGRIHPMAAFRQ
jgi:putative ABC transport system permease protein